MDLNLTLSSIGVFLVIILLLVVILLVAKKYLSPSGKVSITINGKDKIEVEQGGSLASTFLLPVVVRVVAVSASAKFLRAVAKFLTQKRVSSHASR